MSFASVISSIIQFICNVIQSKKRIFQKNLNNNMEMGNEKKIEQRRTNIFENIIACFSFSDNTNIIMNGSLGRDSIEVIHGMR